MTKPVIGAKYAVNAKPNYKRRCINCGTRPTVDLVDAEGLHMHSLELCGPCTFGEARMADPKEWNKESKAS